MSTNDPRIEILADFIEQQAIDSKLTDGRIRQKMAVSERTLYRLKPKALALVNTRQLQRQKEIEATRTHEATEAAKKGLKSKTERVLNLQRQIDDIQKDLDNNATADYVVIGGKLQKVSKEIPATDRAFMRKTIKDIQAEISKIEGDYAPDKFEDVTKPTVILPGE